MAEMSPEEREHLFGDVDTVVKVTIKGKTYEVPEDLELLRCFQFLGFHIAFENFCWNANCENCATVISRAGQKPERTLCCQTPAEEGVAIPTLPEGVEIPDE